MKEEPTKLSDVVRQLDSIVDNAHSLECELKECVGGVVFSGNRDGFLYIALRIIQLADKGISGSHFTIDKFDITPDAEIELTIARKDFDQ